MNKFLITIAIFLTGLTGLHAQGYEMQIREWPYDCEFRADSGRILINNIQEFRRATVCSALNYEKYKHYTIIGLQGMDGGCCSPGVEFKVYRDDKKKEYLIEATVIIYGACRRNNHYKRVVYVNKFKDGYRVVFEKLRASENECPTQNN